jgi:hypothetical protein
MRPLSHLLLLIGLTALPISTSAQEAFTVFPRAIHLTGPGSSSMVLVQETGHRTQQGQSTVSGQLTSGLLLRTSQPAIARVENDRVVAVSDGVTELLVSVGGAERVARVPVIVRQTDAPIDWQFEAHVQPIFSKLGCNSGACHGALAGKGGFKLSLLAYDSQQDHYAITAQDQGRRIEPANPTASLLLTKPTTQVAHKGGYRLDPDSNDYRLLAQWIASGSSESSPDQAALAGIEVLPDQLQLKMGASQEMIVRAHYEDGRIEDVTHWARFSSADESVLEVDNHGVVRVLGSGRGAVVAWFSSRIAMASIDVPYTHDQQSPVANFQPANFIDEILLSEWQLLGLAPSVDCDDATFLRRAHLTATGSLPTAEEVEKFLNDDNPNRRRDLVDRLLASPAYVDYWAYRWSDLLLVNGNLLRPKPVEAFYNWIRQQVEKNVAWDQMVRQVILAKGDSISQGATNFYAIHQTPEALTENTCLAFMGLSIDCAKCHNHPLEKWTNDQYYAMANLFSRVRAKGWGGDSRNGDGIRTIVVLDRGDLVQPSRGQPQPPAPLDQPPLDPESTEDRREALADWLTSPENPYFSKAIVNRVWANFMGPGLVEPVDDMRVSNPPISQRLMASLAAYLVENDYDLKSLMRLIMNSRTFQLSSQPNERNRQDQRFYCRFTPRRLDAEVLHDAVVHVTEIPTLFNQIAFAGADRQPTDLYPEGTRALQLYDSAVSSYFLQTFGRHQRRITCECEKSNEPTVVQVLHLSNGSTINEKLANPASIVSRWLDSELPPRQIIEQAYLRALCRMPYEREVERLLEQVVAFEGDSDDRREIIEDLLWGLMTSREFLFVY